MKRDASIIGYYSVEKNEFNRTVRINKLFGNADIILRDNKITKTIFNETDLMRCLNN